MTTPGNGAPIASTAEPFGTAPAAKKKTRVKLPPQLQALMQQLVFECKVNSSLHGISQQRQFRAFATWQAAADQIARDEAEEAAELQAHARQPLPLGGAVGEAEDALGGGADGGVGVARDVLLARNVRNSCNRGTLGIE